MLLEGKIQGKEILSIEAGITVSSRPNGALVGEGLKL